MKNIIKFLFFWSISLSFAQETTEYIAKVTYTKKSLLPPIGNINTYLYFTDNFSQYTNEQKQESHKTEEDYTVSFAPLFFINNYDFQTNTVEENRILDGNVILYAKWDNDLEWEITNEEKMISEYRVKKAILRKKIFQPNDDIEIEETYAWFTTDIPVPTGPDRLYGLPGLVLEVSYNKTRSGFNFDKIEYIPKSDFQFRELNKENQVEEKEDVIWLYHKNPKKIKEIQRKNRKKK